MADFIPVTGWNNHNYPGPKHIRTESYSHSKAPPSATPRPVSKSISSSALHTLAVVSGGSPLHTPRRYDDEDGNLSTLPDPRSRTMSPANDNSPSSPSQHPDLSNEVATLSNKLINAINHQTNLDDTLSATRHELEASRERCRQLEQQTQEHAGLLARGILIQKSSAESEKNKLILDLGEERKKRKEVEKDKKAIELELENLTTALFEEANKMVISAREEAQKEYDIVQKRNEQLKTQLADTDSLLKSHQEQLAELKQVMEQMTADRDDQTNPTAPSTPGLSKFDSKDETSEDAYALQSTSAQETISPTYPTSFTHLLHTVLRTDLSAYEDFTALLKMSKNVIGSRTSSGSYGSIGLGLGLGGYASSSAHPTNGSTSSLGTAGTLGSSPVTPTTPASSVSAGSQNGPNSLTPLKETKFYKRSLAEDIEPTLRLDTAPGLSWLARRTVLNSVCDGTLIVDPMPTSTKPHLYACSLCGEIRKDSAHSRSHRFRTSENENAQRYPLCKYCLGRVRSTCDFLGFLRILKDGHWRADDEESEKAAWEESVRLREQMFWARIGGGVVPVIHQPNGELSKSPRDSEDMRKEEERKLSEELKQTGEIKPKDVTTSVEQTPNQSTKRSSEVIDPSSNVEDSEQAHIPVLSTHSDEPKVTEIPTNNHETILVSESSSNGHDSSRLSTQLTASPQGSSPSGGEADAVKRLSITIPGSFD